LNRQCREHLKILDLLEAGNVTEASAFLRQHIEGANTLKIARRRATAGQKEQRPGLKIRPRSDCRL